MITFVFLFISYIVNGIIIWTMPKRLTKQEYYITWISVSFITIVTDLFIGQFLDEYDLLFKSGPEIIDVLVEISLPASFGVLFVNFLPKDRSKRRLYIVFWVALSVAYELIAHHFGYIKFKGWKNWYSVPYYFCACIFMVWQYRFMKKLNINDICE